MIVQGDSLSPLEQKGLSSDKHSETIQNRIQRLDSRNDLQTLQRTISPSRNMRNCSLQPIAMIAASDQARSTDIKIRVNEYGYGFSGLATCDNPFCLFCSKGKAMDRGEKIKQVLVNTRETHSQFFVTFTIPRQYSPLDAYKDIQRRWKKVQDRLTYIFKTKPKRQGLAPSEVMFCKAVDVTFSHHKKKAPYHIHLHCIILIEGVVSVEFMNSIIETWVKKDDGIAIVPQDKGQLIEPVYWGEKTDNGGLQKDGRTLAKYIAKMAGLGLEIANGNNKTGKGKNSLSLVELMFQALKEWKWLNEEQKEEILTFGYAGSEWLTKTKAPHVVLYQRFVSDMKGQKTIAFSQSWKKYMDDLEPYDSTKTTEEQAKKEVVIPLTRWSMVQTKIIEIGRILFRTIEGMQTQEAKEELEEILDMPEKKAKRFFWSWLNRWGILLSFL